MEMNLIWAAIRTSARRQPPPARSSWSSVDELLRRSDVVTLHVPLIDATRGLIDATALGQMKPTACAHQRRPRRRGRRSGARRGAAVTVVWPAPRSTSTSTSRRTTRRCWTRRTPCSRRTWARRHARRSRRLASRSPSRCSTRSPGAPALRRQLGAAPPRAADGRAQSQEISTRRSSWCATASQRIVAEGRFQGRQDPRCHRSASARPRSWVHVSRIATLARRCPFPPARRCRSGTHRCPGPCRQRGRSRALRPSTSRLSPYPSVTEIAQGEWEGQPSASRSRALGSRAGGLAPDARNNTMRQAANRSPKQPNVSPSLLTGSMDRSPMTMPVQHDLAFRARSCRATPTRTQRDVRSSSGALSLPTTAYSASWC